MLGRYLTSLNHTSMSHKENDKWYEMLYENKGVVDDSMVHPMDMHELDTIIKRCRERGTLKAFGLELSAQLTTDEQRDLLHLLANEISSQV